MSTGSWYYDIWVDRRFLDSWHVNHALAGFLLGAFFSFMNAYVVVSLAASLVIMLAWEAYERVNGDSETWQNGTLDVVVGVAGFAIAWQGRALLATAAYVTSFVVALVIWVILEVWGFVAYRKLHAARH